MEVRLNDTSIQSYRDLRVWREAITLAEMAYRHTREFPKDELFGLTSQIGRAAASVPANIAEGYRGEHWKLRAIPSHYGECKEVETHTLLAERVLNSHPNPEDLLRQCDIIRKCSTGLFGHCNDFRLPTAACRLPVRLRKHTQIRIEAGRLLFAGPVGV